MAVVADSELVARIYLSRSPQPLDVTTLRALADRANVRNRSDGVTGFLTHRNGVFTQYIEGSPQAIDALWSRLLADDRHSIERHANLVVSERRFGEWGMHLLDPLWFPSGAPLDVLEEVLGVSPNAILDSTALNAVTSVVDRVSNAQ